MTQPMPRAAAPTRCHQFRTRTPFQRAVRGLLVLMALEAVCALGYSVYIVVLVSISETRNTREEYFGAGFLSILAAALVLFVATAVQYGNSYQLAAANLISIALCLGPFLILFKQVPAAEHTTTARSTTAPHERSCLQLTVRFARQPDRTGKAGLIAEVTESVDSSLRIAFAVIAVILGTCFGSASVVVQQEFAWKRFLVRLRPT